MSIPAPINATTSTTAAAASFPTNSPSLTSPDVIYFGITMIIIGFLMMALFVIWLVCNNDQHRQLFREINQDDGEIEYFNRNLIAAAEAAEKRNAALEKAEKAAAKAKKKQDDAMNKLHDVASKSGLPMAADFMRTSNPLNGSAGAAAASSTMEQHLAQRHNSLKTRTKSNNKNDNDDDGDVSEFTFASSKHSCAPAPVVSSGRNFPRTTSADSFVRESSATSFHSVNLNMRQQSPSKGFPAPASEGRANPFLAIQQHSGASFSRTNSDAALPAASSATSFDEFL